MTIKELLAFIEGMDIGKRGAPTPVQWRRLLEKLEVIHRNELELELLTKIKPPNFYSPPMKREETR